VRHRHPASHSNSSTLHLVERIVRAADRDHHADAVLRHELKTHREISPREASEISRAVFAYHRWFGWLDRRKTIREQIEQASRLAEEFARNPGSFSGENLIARAVPGWLKDEMEVTAEWARTLQAEPKLWLRARPGQGKDLARKLGDCRILGAGHLADTLEYRGHQDLFLTPGFHAGEFELQDLGSQLVGWICGAKPGETWWDACAGEGGKTLHLSALMGNKGLIWATDRAAWRLQRLKRRAARAQAFNYRAKLWDAGANLPTKTKFDGVLLDAPCSGVGTWQRNPHARWTTTARDVRELGVLQKDLLARAGGAVKPGGKLLYAVCSLTTAETTAVVEDFERRFPQFRPFPVQNSLLPGHPPAARLWFWPQDFACNGMFTAVWARE
jgi:16S rRNA (cytosine967-C5)-methyltransferase